MPAAGRRRKACRWPRWPACCDDSCGPPGCDTCCDRDRRKQPTSHAYIGYLATGFAGVCYKGSRFAARVNVGGDQTYLGTYDTAE